MITREGDRRGMLMAIMRASGISQLRDRTSLVVYRTTQDSRQAGLVMASYHDRVEPRGGVLNFKKRRVVPVSRWIDVLLVYPI